MTGSLSDLGARRLLEQNVTNLVTRSRAIVLDVWSRRVVGWSTSASVATPLVLAALVMAIRLRQPSGVVHHSDEGCQYTSVAFGQRCVDAGIEPSTGTVGDAYDDAMAESVFSTLENELLARRPLRSRVQTRGEVFSFIEGYLRS